MHQRLAPKNHSFKHDIFMFYIDLDEVELLGWLLALFSHNRRNVYSFRDADHEPAGNGSLKQRILQHVTANGIEIKGSPRVMLLTLPRVFGYIFNPISVYYCFDALGQPVCAVAEVGNTFREMKLYLLGPGNLGADAIFQKTTAKHFYVSPFSRLDLKFDFRLRVPGETLNIKIDDLEGGEKILMSALTGCRAALGNRNLLWFSIKYPMVTLKVIFLIHWHAFRLWLKRVPFYRKQNDLALQRDVLRPHSTLAAK